MTQCFTTTKVMNVFLYPINKHSNINIKIYEFWDLIEFLCVFNLSAFSFRWKVILGRSQMISFFLFWDFICVCWFCLCNILLILISPRFFLLVNRLDKLSQPCMEYSYEPPSQPQLKKFKLLLSAQNAR